MLIPSCPLLNIIQDLLCCQVDYVFVVMTGLRCSKKKKRKKEIWNDGPENRC